MRALFKKPASTFNVSLLPSSPSAFESPLSCGLRLLGILACLVGGVPLVLVLRVLHPKWGLWGVQKVLKGLGKCLKLTLDIRGTPSPGQGILFVANHISYSDIVVLGTLLKARFVAKEEVSRWPLIGWGARAAGTLFVSRSSHSITKELGRMKGCHGERGIILFPEGTSTDGTTVLPFRSTFFQLAMDPRHPCPVQPVSLTYRTLCGRPMGRFFRKIIGWRGDVEFFESLRALLRLGPMEVCVTFHAPLYPQDFHSRKSLATSAQKIVARGVENCIYGLEPSVDRQPPPSLSSDEDLSPALPVTPG
jgi:1-acyl-sn-glycerol-3-phosphate acyltransferase